MVGQRIGYIRVSTLDQHTCTRVSQKHHCATYKPVELNRYAAVVSRPGYHFHAIILSPT